MRVVNVEGRAKEEDVRVGRIILLNEVDNDSVDRRAVSGANVHAVPPFVVGDCLGRKERASALQLVMLRMFGARHVAEGRLGPAADANPDGDVEGPMLHGTVGVG